MEFSQRAEVVREGWLIGVFEIVMGMESEEGL